MTGHQRHHTLRLTCSITSDGKLGSVNDILCYVLGYTRDELVGSSVGALLRPGEDVHQTEAAILAKFDRVRELNDGSVERYESCLLAKDQIRIDCDSTVAWNQTFQCWDVVASVDAAQIAHRARPQFPPDDPDAQLARLMLQENAAANQHIQMQRLAARLDALGDNTVRLQEMAAAAAAAATAAIVQQLHLFQNGTVPSEPVPQAPAPPPPPAEPLEHFDIEEWNSYAGFRAHVLGLWKDGMTREQLAGLAGCGRRTFYRARQRWHVDGRRDWPPTRWPLQEPKPRRKPRRTAPRKLLGSRELGGLAAAGWLFFATLDSLDGRLDGIVRICLKTAFSGLAGTLGWSIQF